MRHDMKAVKGCCSCGTTPVQVVFDVTISQYLVRCAKPWLHVLKPRFSDLSFLKNLFGIFIKPRVSNSLPTPNSFLFTIMDTAELRDCMIDHKRLPVQYISFQHFKQCNWQLHICIKYTIDYSHLIPKWPPF